MLNNTREANLAINKRKELEKNQTTCDTSWLSCCIFSTTA